MNNKKGRKGNMIKLPLKEERKVMDNKVSRKLMNEKRKRNNQKGQRNE